MKMTMVQTKKYTTIHNASSLQYNESEHESEEAYDLLESQRRIIVYWNDVFVSFFCIGFRVF